MPMNWMTEEEARGVMDCEDPTYECPTFGGIEDCESSFTCAQVEDCRESTLNSEREFEQSTTDCSNLTVVE